MSIDAICDNVMRIVGTTEASSAAQGGQSHFCGDHAARGAAPQKLGQSPEPAAARWTFHAARLGWIVLAVAVSVKAVLVPVDHSVYPCFEAGGRAWWSGQDLYPHTCGHEFRYGPVAAMALAPLALLPTAWGGLLWIWLNLGVFFAALRALMKRILPGPWTPQREGLFLCLVLVGITRSIWSGQSNLLVFGLVALAAVAIADRRWWLAACLLAIPVHIKVWPLAVALLLVACWPRRLAPRLAVCLLAIGAVPFLTKPFPWVCRQYGGWFAVLTGPAQMRHSYRDAWTLWEAIHPPVHPTIYLALQLAAAAVVLGLCLWQARRNPSATRLLLFVLVAWACWQMVFGPATEPNTFGLIAPLSAWALLTCLEEKRGRIVMGVAFVLMVAANFSVVEASLRPIFPLITAAHPIGVLLLAGWFLWWNVRTGRAVSRVLVESAAADLDESRILSSRIVDLSGDADDPSSRLRLHDDQRQGTARPGYTGCRGGKAGFHESRGGRGTLIFASLR